jgi:hypothetical protein
LIEQADGCIERVVDLVERAAACKELSAGYHEGASCFARLAEIDDQVLMIHLQLVDSFLYLTKYGK